MSFGIARVVGSITKITNTGLYQPSAIRRQP